MRIIQDEIIIDDPYIIEFMTKYGNTDFLNMCENLLKNICRMCEKNLSNENYLDNFLSHLNIFKADLTKGIVNEITKQERQIDLTPISSHLNDIKERINLSKIVDNGINNRGESILTNIIHTQKTLENIGTKIDDMKIIRNTNRYKGESAENDLRDVLEQTFQLRDNYEIVETKTIPNSCDFIIKHIGYCDIRIECKNYTYDVGTAEVKKFESDIICLNNHGIFISIGTKICGKGLIEINLLPNNRLAVYLSNNNYDREIIKDMVNLIYKIDMYNSESGFKITLESVVQIKNYLNDYTSKVKHIKMHLKSSLELLGNLDFNYIERLINGGQINKIENDSNIKCEYCNKTFKKQNGLTSHLKICKKKKVNINEEE